MMEWWLVWLVSWWVSWLVPWWASWFVVGVVVGVATSIVVGSWLVPWLMSWLVVDQWLALLKSSGIIDLGAFCVELWSFFVSKRISVPM